MIPIKFKFLITLSFMIAITIFWDLLMYASSEGTCSNYEYLNGIPMYPEDTCTNSFLNSCKAKHYQSDLYEYEYTHV